jgi:PAS domain S-box-containing protein
MRKISNRSINAAELRRCAEDQLRKRQDKESGVQASEADAQRLLHELQVHQIELEMQNTELQRARDDAETALEKIADLYDFAPVGYFSLDERGMILEMNLTGASLLGAGRSQLISRCILHSVAPASRLVFFAFLEKVFSGSKKHTCEAALLKADGTAFWANIHGSAAISLDNSQRWCRVAVSDITAHKQAEEAQHRLAAVTATNLALQQEIAKRKAAAETLKQSERHQIQLLDQSRQMQQQLRQLSHQILQAQEEERKRISRELHDEITQTLVGINVHLATLAQKTLDPKDLKKKIAQTQRLVEKSVEIAHQFALKLRPTMLDDLGLIPALRSLMKSFMEETGIRVSLTIFEEVEKLNSAKRTVLYRIAQEALNNVARHAQATKVEVSIQRLPKALLMQIKDNGKSFDVEHALHPSRNKRLGLIGMRERLEMVNGQFAIESAPGKGTTVQAQIPFAGRAKERAQS